MVRWLIHKIRLTSCDGHKTLTSRQNIHGINLCGRDELFSNSGSHLHFLGLVVNGCDIPRQALEGHRDFECKPEGGRCDDDEVENGKYLEERISSAPAALLQNTSCILTCTHVQS